jgi:3-oxoacyl-[acyl-carrier protein] reductase
LTEIRYAVITGGLGDLATALATVLRDAGYSVWNPGRDELDVTDADRVECFFRSVPRVDLLINNAGIKKDLPMLRMTEEAWDSVIKVNLKGAFLCSQAAVKGMSWRGSGHILNVSSFSAVRPPLGQANYAAAKAGMIGLTKSLAAEFGKRGVRVNAVLPGFLETKMTADIPEEAVAAIRARHVLERFNTCADAARFMVFLDSMSAVSGQVFQLDSRLDRW